MGPTGTGGRAAAGAGRGARGVARVGAVGIGVAAIGVAAVGLVAMTAPGAATGSGATPADAAAPPAADTVVSQAATFVVEEVLSGLEVPVAMAFLPDGRAILAQRRAGSFGLFDPATGTLQDVAGGPRIRAEGDGGALDVVVHPEGGPDGWIYLAYSADTDGGSATALARARLRDRAFVDLETLFVARPAAAGDLHFGGRVAFADGHLFLTVGDREVPDEARSTASHHGTVVRLRPDGSVPDDNPFVGVPWALPEVWSYGHRNPQGMAVEPGSGRLWLNEHGPQGGDELNVVRPGADYGWPLVTYGEAYGGGPIGDGRVARPGTTQPVYFYRPSIAPSDLVFPTGAGFPGWRSSALVGALALTHLNRLTVHDGRVLHEERLLAERGWRIRMVEEAPDGSIYLGTDAGLLVRLRPVSP